MAKTGSGEDAVVTKVTWAAGEDPAEEATRFQFPGRADSGKTYEFTVRQTYSDGEVVNWTGPEDSDAPAPVIEARSSFGGGGGTSIVSIIALVVGGLALVLAIAALVSGGGRRPLA